MVPQRKVKVVQNKIRTKMCAFIGLLCSQAAPCLLPRPPPLLCSTASPCSCCKPLIGTTLTTGCWWNSLLLFIKQSALDLFILTPSFTCLAMEDWKDWSTSIEKSTCSPSCSAKQCFQRAFSSCSSLRLGYL